MLAVLFFHAAKYAPHEPGLGARLLSLGYHGVDLFFVISGYCLAYPTLVRVRANGRVNFDVVHYLTRRIVRILPPYEFALLAFVIVLAIFGSIGVSAPADMLSPLDFGNVARDALLLDANTTHINQSFWTLALEFRWYFVFPFALALWIRFPRAFVCAIGACVFASYLTHAASADVSYLPAFLLGIVAADGFVRRPAIARYAPVLFVGALAAAAVVPLPPGIPVSIFWQLALFALVVAAGNLAWLRAALSVRVLSVIGVASYSIYLVHQPVVAFAAHVVAGAIAIPALAVFATGAIGLGCGFAFWALVERPLTSARMRATLERPIEKWIDRAFDALRIPRAIVP